LAQVGLERFQIVEPDAEAQQGSLAEFPATV